MATNLVIPSDIQSRSPEQRADYYAQQRMAGFSDPAIRNAVSGAFGPQPDSDWNYLLQLSGYNDVAPDSLYRSPTSGNSLIAALRGNTPQQPAGSVSSFSMLPNRVQPTPPPAPTTSQRPNFLNQVTPFQPVDGTGSQTTPSGGNVANSPAASPTVGGTTPARALPSFTPWVSSDLSGEEKAALFNNYLQRGFTGKDLRLAVEKSFGNQKEEDWTALLNFASQQPKDLLPTNNPQGLFKNEIQTAVRNWQQSKAPAPAPIAAPAPAPVAAPVAAPAPVIAPAPMQPFDQGNDFDLMDAALIDTPAPVQQETAAQPLTINADFAAMSPQQKADLYNSYLGSYSDADIRAAIEAQLGPQPDEDWAYLRRLAAGGIADVGQDQDTLENVIDLYERNMR